jgi:hypothetical protein
MSVALPHEVEISKYTWQPFRHYFLSLTKQSLVLSPFVVCNYAPLQSPDWSRPPSPTKSLRRQAPQIEASRTKAKHLFYGCQMPQQVLRHVRIILILKHSCFDFNFFFCLFFKLSWCMLYSTRNMNGFTAGIARPIAVQLSPTDIISWTWKLIYYDHVFFRNISPCFDFSTCWLLDGLS